MQELENAIRDAYLDLNTIDTASFSEGAFSSFRQQIVQFIIQLFDESLRAAKRTKADTVSPSHIETAANHLVKKSKSKKEQLLNTVGGLFLGSTISNTFAITMLNAEYSAMGILLTVLFGILGSFLLGYNLSRD